MNLGARLLGLLTACVVAALLTMSPARAAPRERQQAREMLSREVSLTFNDTPLGTVIAELAKVQGFEIVIDRRVDPTTEIDVTLVDTPLAIALAKTTSEAHCKATWLSDVIYLGPAAAAEKLRTVAAMRRGEIEQLADPLKSKALATKRLRCQRLATPRDVLAELAKEIGCKIENPNAAPHDLLPKIDLPPLPWHERVSLLLVQFDLTFTLDPRTRTLTWIAIPDEVSIDRKYSAGARGPQLASDLATKFPSARVKPDGGDLQVVGMAEAHDWLEERLQGRAAPDKAPGRTTTVKTRERYHLKMETVPLDALLDKLEQQLKLTIEIDKPSLAAARVEMSQLIDLDVKDVSLDELLDATFAKTGLEYDRRGQKVEVRAKAR